jgi:dolichol kinase
MAMAADAARDRHAPFRHERQRKTIHIASAVLAAVVWFGSREAALALLGFLAVVAVAVDLARLRIPAVRRRFLGLTHPLLRRHERRALSGATHMALAYALSALLFPTAVAVAAILYNALGDAAGALVGTTWGRRPVAPGKTLAGSTAVLVVCLVVGLLVPGIPPAAAVLGALGAAVLEAAPLPVNDNLRITLGGGAFLWVAILLLGG